MFASSVPQPPVTWYADVTYPIKPQPPTGAGVNNPSSNLVGSVPTLPQVGGLGLVLNVTSGVGTSSDVLTQGGMWCHKLITANVATTRFQVFRLNYWKPNWDRTTAPAIDDETSRIGWFRAFIYASGAEPADTADSVGIGLVPSDMRDVTLANYNVPQVGGFGIFKKAGSAAFRYASYSAAPALLEAIDLNSTVGWHVADFIIRSAKLNDATTPWMTFQWDGVTIFSQRVFGSANLIAPSAARALAIGYDVTRGCANAQGSIAYSLRFRCGPFMPDGTPVY